MGRRGGGERGCEERGRWEKSGVSECKTFSPPQVHVNIIVEEARMQAELIYAMRALMRFMKS